MATASSCGDDVVVAAVSDLSADNQRLAGVLVAAGQLHLFKGWAAGACTEQRNAFFDAVRRVEAAYPGGIVGYVESARKFLRESAMGVNPLDGYRPSVPSGVNMIDADDATIRRYESIAVRIFKDCAFVLVAGGLGERLGYNGIKVKLPVTLASGKCYLQTYVEEILALEALSNAIAGNAPDSDEYARVPLAIMVSDDTDAQTRHLLKRHSSFGMAEGQITIMKQEPVPAVIDNDAHFARDGTYGFVTKPHGHGDVHTLLHTTGLAAKWAAEGRKYLAFFQDTNAACFRFMPQAIGIAADRSFNVLSMCIPRKAREAVGAIATLTHDDGSQITTCVEYNQLEPLLIATGHKDGDTNDPATGFSPYPGNMNQLIMSIPEYAHVLKTSGGKVPEFVNPKYADVTKTTFKKPTRLECMMQDLPKVLPRDAVVGFATFPLASFSPVKNSVEGAIEKQTAGLPPQCALSGEMDVYAATCDRLAALGVRIGAAQLMTAQGITVARPAAISLSPTLTATTATLAAAFPTPDKVVITQRSFLVVRGSGAVTFHSLHLDGALVVHAPAGTHTHIRDATVHNTGWDFELLPAALPTDATAGDEVKAEDEGPSSTVPEFIRIRGYNLVRHAHTRAVLDDQGNTVYTSVLDASATSSHPKRRRQADSPAAGAPAPAKSRPN